MKNVLFITLIFSLSPFSFAEQTIETKNLGTGSCFLHIDIGSGIKIVKLIK